MNRRTQTASLAAVALVLVTAAAHARLGRAEAAQVSFTAQGPAGMSIVGTTSDLQIAETDQDIVVTVPLKNLDTKISLRNKHMREKYLEVDKYPNAELRVPKSQIQTPKGAPTGGKANGTLSLHGQTKPVSFTYAAKPEGGNVAVNGTVHVVMTDFGIEKPGYAGVSVKPDVDVAVAFRVQDN